jgi:hypothetical protein
MSRCGVSSDIAEQCLGHVIGGVRGVYDRHRYESEKRSAFEALARLITTIVQGGGTVAPFTKERKVSWSRRWVGRNWWWRSLRGDEPRITRR